MGGGGGNGRGDFLGDVERSGLTRTNPVRILLVKE